MRALRVTEDSVTLNVALYDVVEQRINSQVVTLAGHGIHLRPVAMRYSWPAELDLMAGQAGLRLAERHGGWQRTPFESTSGWHVSVYRRVTA